MSIAIMSQGALVMKAINKSNSGYGRMFYDTERKPSPCVSLMPKEYPKDGNELVEYEVTITHETERAFGVLVDAAGRIEWFPKQRCRITKRDPLVLSIPKWLLRRKKWID